MRLLDTGWLPLTACERPNVELEGQETTRVNQIMNARDSWALIGCPLLLANVQKVGAGMRDNPGERIPSNSSKDQQQLPDIWISYIM
jgi:hypothetical protein